MPAAHAPPAGRLILACDASEAVVGGVGLCRVEPGLCEMKRLYVRANWRGRQLGRRLAEAIVETARGAGYVRMRLHTLTRLTAAIALYRSMGFTELPAAHDGSSDDDIHMELDLRTE